MTDQLSGSAKRRELLTFAEVAQRLGLGVLTVRQWVRTEQCPVVRVGRKVRIPVAWVDDPAGWLNHGGTAMVAAIGD